MAKNATECGLYFMNVTYPRNVITVQIWRHVACFHNMSSDSVKRDVSAVDSVDDANQETWQQCMHTTAIGDRACHTDQW